MKKNQTTCFKPKFKLNLQHFAAEDDAAADDVNTGSDEGQNTDTSQAAGNVQSDGDNKNDTQLSADEVRQIAEANVLKSLGVSSVKDAKAQLDSWKEYEDSKKTEEDKINDRIAELEEDNTGKDSMIYELNAKLAASNLDVDPESVDDVIVLAKSMTDKDSELKIEDAIKSVVERYPAFKKEDGTQTPNGVFPNSKATRVTASADDAFEAINQKYKR